MKKGSFLKKQRGVISVYVGVCIITFMLVLSAIYTIAATSRKEQLKTLVKIKEVYEQDGEVIDLLKEINQLEECKKYNMLEATSNTTIQVRGYQVTIPAGYMVTADSGNTVEEGIVITDAESDGNEWVWVPVSNEELDAMYENSLATPRQLRGTLAPDAKTNYYTKTIITGKTRVAPGVGSGYREPDLVLGTGTQYDAVDANRIKAGFCNEEGEVADNLDQMAAQMVIEYEKMLNSIRTNKGFYIGRYELGKVSSTDKTGVVKRWKDAKVSTTWYEFYSDCKGLAKEGSNATTRMIYGLQWDATCKWLEMNGFDIMDSKKWGNYINYNTGNGYTIDDEEYIEGVIVETDNKPPKQTGYSDYWSACNIYDFAGNCWEWTQEVHNEMRSRNGGDSPYAGSTYPASYRYGTNPTPGTTLIRYSSYANN